ncbi:hypothetical protein [Virgibacillus doumboii]|uniref:hypothetical protein n=1 Tax=Virgibacillus doumboii TaxID=2697503 RepID=UPI0013DED1CC|nr:hypothetical protein [Virgibacillus doumboii]
MESVNKRILLLLGICVMSIWTAVIVVFLTAGNEQVILDKHVESQNGVKVKNEITFDKQTSKTDKVYAMHTKKQSTSMKLDSIMVTNESDKVSIDVLLEMLDVKEE